LIQLGLIVTRRFEIIKCRRNQEKRIRVEVTCQNQEERSGLERLKMAASIILWMEIGILLRVTLTNNVRSIMPIGVLEY